MYSTGKMEDNQGQSKKITLLNLIKTLAISLVCLPVNQLIYQKYYVKCIEFGNLANFKQNYKNLI